MDGINNQLKDYGLELIVGDYGDDNVWFKVIDKSSKDFAAMKAREKWQTELGKKYNDDSIPENVLNLLGLDSNIHRKS